MHVRNSIFGKVGIPKILWFLYYYFISDWCFFSFHCRYFFFSLKKKCKSLRCHITENSSHRVMYKSYEKSKVIDATEFKEYIF